MYIVILQKKHSNHLVIVYILQETDIYKYTPTT